LVFISEKQIKSTGSLLAKSIDCSHNLTHLRVRTSTTGICGVSADAWIYLPLIGNSAKSTSRSRKDHMWSNASTLLTEGIPLVSLASYQFFSYPEKKQINGIIACEKHRLFS
jgi:hypothetical protein